MTYQAALPLLPCPAGIQPAAPRLVPSSFSATSFDAALELRLRRLARRGSPIALGSVESPYVPEPGSRSPLAVLTPFDGLQVTVTTRSPRFLDDLDRLVDLDRRHAVTVDVVLAAIDPFLVRRLEPQAPDARTRLRMVARLAAEGIAVRLVCAPWRPGLNDGEPGLRALLQAARDAGAQDVLAHACPASASRLARLRGALKPLVHSEDAGQGLATLERLRLEHGFPRPVAGRG